MDPGIIKIIKNAPRAPGVYIFYRQKTALYIGKAARLKTRLQNYLNDPRLAEATRLKIIKLASPIEALIKESRLIKKLKPEINVHWQDDRGYFYVAFTREKFPRIFVTHRLNPKPYTLNPIIIGPFTEGAALKLILKILRRRYPYCTCFKPHLRTCLNSQINLCPGYCCQKNVQLHDREDRRKKYYLKNIKIIQAILTGKKKDFLKKIARPEDQWAVENILAHSNFVNSGHSNTFARLHRYAKHCGQADLDRFRRIECYDVSNFAGKEAVGAMTVLINKNGDWQPDRNQFRLFRVKSAPARDDPRMIAEILQRRLNHPEWPYPDLIIIDGGLTQYNAAKKALLKANSYKLKAHLISFAKPHKKIYGQSPVPKATVEKAINQTHHYVIAYHRRIRDTIKA